MRTRAALLGLCLSTPALAATASPSVPVPADETLAPVVITATRVAEDAFQLPAAVQSEPIRRDGPGVTLADSLAAVPGLAFRERENRAQEASVSVRGFGARSTFGIRGVRVLQDDVPATQPDGQGQISQFDLATAERVEILRGPFSALYGNSSGGVLQLFSAAGQAPAQARLALNAGPAGERVLQADAQDALDRDPVTWRLHGGGADFRTDGLRGHSAAHRDTLLARVTRETAAGSRLLLSFNALRSPEAQDPLGLTAAQFAADPWQAAPAAVQFNTRKSTRQAQGSAVFDTAASGWGSVHAMAYLGSRGVTQFLAIPVATQADPRHSGGVVDLATRFGGGELRWSLAGAGALGDWRATLGASLDRLVQLRRGYENFQGTTLGVAGALRRDEEDSVRALDGYAQLEWTPRSRATLVAGVRRSDIRFAASDRYIRTGNPDDSGAARYGATSPVFSALWRLAPQRNGTATTWRGGLPVQANLYASLGTGFETPTLAELAYRTDGRAGLNFDLQPSRARQVEVGLKLRRMPGWHADLALFRARSERELVTVSNSGGRAAYANAGRAERSGVELSVGAQWSAHFDGEASFTSLHAVTLDGYLTCTVTPCTAPSTRIAAGSRLAGVAPRQFDAELGWRPVPGWRLSLAWRGTDAVPVDDLNSQSAAAWQTWHAALSRQGPGAAGAWQGFVRIDNLTDRRYAGSVIVNDANGRYYEAAPGRTLRVGVSLRLGGRA